MPAALADCRAGRTSPPGRANPNVNRPPKYLVGSDVGTTCKDVASSENNRRDSMVDRKRLPSQPAVEGVALVPFFTAD
jgi:hypothetical protein